MISHEDLSEADRRRAGPLYRRQARQKGGSGRPSQRYRRQSSCDEARRHHAEETSSISARSGWGKTEIARRLAMARALHQGGGDSH